MPLPSLALTLGDIAGIGPEVVVLALLDERVRQCCRPIVVGHGTILQRAARLLKADLAIREVTTVDAALEESSAVACWNPTGSAEPMVPAGINHASAGRAAYDYLIAATQAALSGKIDGIVTAPLSKAALHLAGLDYPGHTEILAEQCGVQDFAMMLYLSPQSGIGGPRGLGVAHVTLHTSIRSVPDLLSRTAIREKIGLIQRFMQDVGCESPRIGVCALNPHAGEEGLFGDEEARLIAPAVADARQQAINANGPIPADALMKRACGGQFDGVVAMYHDQGHIALKLVGADRAVNVTLGLPIVRTSPSHGTAFDIAWQGRASAQGMIEAICTAARLAVGKSNLRRDRAAAADHRTG